MLQAPVATSVSGKGAISDGHPLAVGWGYGPQASVAAENVFNNVDVLLAIGVKFSEVSTGYYGNFQPKHVVHARVFSRSSFRFRTCGIAAMISSRVSHSQ